MAQKEDIEVDLAPVMARRGIAFRPEGAKRLLPAANRIELNDGSVLDYDYLIIATGPELAFDEIEGLGPEAQHPVRLPSRSRACQAKRRSRSSPHPVARPSSARSQGASCYGPAYEFAFILETALRRRKVRDRVPMTFVTPEPYIGHLGLDGVGDTKSLLESAMREKHIKWITNAKVVKGRSGDDACRGD